MGRVVLAFDKFRGTATQSQLNAAVADALVSHGHEVQVAMLSDGGEGSLDVVGGANKTYTVTGPLGGTVSAGWRLEGTTAHIEMAAAAGLDLAGGPEANDAMAASTAGVGQLITRAAELGATEIVVYHGGSATTDGGWGAIEALSAPQRLRHLDLVAAVDVSTRFTEAATVFGPQKGATESEVAMLTRRLERLAGVYADRWSVEVDAIAGSGAAGGLAGGLAAIGARIESGFDVLADFVELDEQLETADLVMTGEGQFDAGSMSGKLVGGVARRARAAKTEVVAIVGQVADGAATDFALRDLTETYGSAAAHSRTVELVVAEALAALG